MQNTNTTPSSSTTPSNHDDDEQQSIIKTHIEEDMYKNNNDCFGIIFCLHRHRRRRRELIRDEYDDDDEEGYLLTGTRSTSSSVIIITNCDRDDQREIWLMRKLRKVREVSEMMAGPKWKNLIRRIAAYFRTKRRVRLMRRKNSVVRYDEFDYALNFDDGVCDEGLEEHDRLRFSTRYAPAVRVSDHVQKAIPVS